VAQGLAFIFDMDGVIVDSNPVHVDVWKAFNRSYGVDTTDAMLSFMYGRHNDEIVPAFFGENLSSEEVSRRGAAKEQLYRDTVKGRVEEILTPGVRDFLERHREAPMAVASNAEPANVACILDETGLAKYFRAIIDGHQVERPKPFPDVYLKAADSIAVQPANCIVFEDSISGVAAAREAGMRVVGVSTTHAELPGVDLLISDFRSEDLEAWLCDQAPHR
jgi:beta-phosphoglucomutase family hydrolase